MIRSVSLSAAFRSSLTVLGLVGAACTPGAPGAPSVSTPAGGASQPAASAIAGAASAQTAAQVVAAMQYDNSDMDPATLSSVTDQQEAGSLYDGLVRYKLGGTEIEPALAEKWDNSENGTKLTFQLRSGVKFHDGAGLKSSDVKFTVDRIRDPASKSPWAGLYQAVKSIETPDDRTVVFNLTNADPSFMVTLAGASGYVVSEKVVKEKGDAIHHEGVGTGAFKLERWTPGSELVLMRNPDWWGGAPKLERVVYKPITDPSTMYAAFESGGVDILQVTDPDRYQKYKADPGHYTITEVPGLITRFFGMNTHAAPFDKPQVREAIIRSVNRQELVDGLFQGMSAVATQAAAPGVDAHVDGVTQYEYDPAKAKQLLAQAGYPNGVSFEMWVGNIDRFTKPATVIQEEFKAVGLNAQIKIIEATSLIASIGKGEAPMFMLSRGQEPAADRLFYTWFSTKSFPPGQNWAYVESKDADGWIDEFRQTSDLARRKELSKKLQQFVNDGAYYDFIDHEKHIFAVHKRIQGFVADPFRSMKMYPVLVSP